MDVRYSPEQLALRDSVVQVVAHLGPTAVGQLDDAERAAKLEAAVAGAGWRELRDPLDDGSPLASGVEAAIVAEELSRGLVDAAYLGPTLAAELRRLAGAPPAGALETVTLVPGLVALADDVTGGALAVDAHGSVSALVLVATDGGHRLATVALADPEVTTDLTRPVARVASGAEPAPVADGAVLTDDDLRSWTALALALTSAELVGTMRGAVDLTVAYASERRQYGAAIGSFQAVQHLLADAFVLMEGSRSAALHAAWAVDALPPADAVAAGAVAKAYCARAVRDVCETAIQVHGGIGNTWECLAHVHLRRGLLSADIGGGMAVSLERVLTHRGVSAAAQNGAN